MRVLVKKTAMKDIREGNQELFDYIEAHNYIVHVEPRGDSFIIAEHSHRSDEEMVLYANEFTVQVYEEYVLPKELFEI